MTAEESAQEVTEETVAEEIDRSEEVIENEEAAAEEEIHEKKKNLFNKKKDKKDIQIEDLNDKLKRQIAEFDNFRKRTDKEKAQMFDMGAKSIAEKVIPVVDNFERALAIASQEQLEDPFVDGMNKVYKQMLTMLDEAGVKVIDAVGQEFDPNLHNAVMHFESEEHGENMVAEEFQKGYLYRDNVIRHSMVKVAN
ncbi:MAG: nucleotide exchange factor GrpE [Lachnospiraceae bacterium]